MGLCVYVCRSSAMQFFVESNLQFCSVDALASWDTILNALIHTRHLGLDFDPPERRRSAACSFSLQMLQKATVRHNIITPL